jgi:hypothetical protein
MIFTNVKIKNSLLSIKLQNVIHPLRIISRFVSPVVRNGKYYFRVTTGVRQFLNSISILPGSSKGIRWDEFSNQTPFFTGALSPFSHVAAGTDGVV